MEYIYIILEKSTSKKKITCMNNKYEFYDVYKNPLSHSAGMMHYRVDVTVIRSSVQESWCKTDWQTDTETDELQLKKNQVPVELSAALALNTRTRFDYLSAAPSTEFVLSRETCCLFEEKRKKTLDYWLHVLMTGCFNSWREAIKWLKRHQCL